MSVWNKIKFKIEEKKNCITSAKIREENKQSGIPKQCSMIKLRLSTVLSYKTSSLERSRSKTNE